MLTAGVVAIGLLLGSRAEAPREEKFLGVLLAQAAVALPDVNDEARRRELDQLIRDRPSLVGAGITLAVGGGVATFGLVIVALGAAAGGFEGLGVAFLGLIVGASGLVVMVIAGLVMIVNAVVRGDMDARIRLLKEQQPPPAQAPPPEMPPPSVMIENAGGLLLARF